ncbi:hypothetical protein H8D36_01445 [archaeon]|nr:hypothetical protein [archaeon]MBL7057189.1 hypothetical protein [Candidatus Woesearchaeota archaeon]
METRKLVRSGNTSFTTALPINWVRKNNLKPGSEIQITETSRGNLLITTTSPIEPDSEKKTSTTIKVDGKTNEEIRIELLIAYIRDMSSVTLEGKEINIKSKMIIEAIHDFIGFDIMDQSDKYITIKNFYSLDQETAPRNINKKIHVINLASFELLKTFFEKGLTQENVFELRKFHNQNKKLSNLTEKSILKAFNDPALMRQIQTNRLQLIKEKKIVSAFKKISYRLYYLGKLLSFIERKSPEVELFKVEFLKIKEHYTSLINAIANKDNEEKIVLLQKFKKHDKLIDDMINRFEDPLMIQAGMSLLIIELNLKDIGYESLT